MTFNQALRNANLKARDEFDALAIKRLLVELCQEQAIDLYLRMDELMPAVLYQRFNDGVNALINDMPLAHILGYEWFYGRKFKVNNHVLIPRPETEELVAQVLDRIENVFSMPFELKVADVACGSGIIGCTLKAELPSLSVTCTDISHEAIEIAKSNAQSLELDITFAQGDMLNPLTTQQWDVIVCNPPYIEENELLETSVIDFEPHIALFGGPDGLALIRCFLDQLDAVCSRKTLVAMEMGHKQRYAITQEIFKRFPNVVVECECDLNGKERMLFFVVEKP